MEDPLEQTAEVAVDLLTVLMWVGIGVLGAILASFVIAVAMRLAARRHPWARVVSRRGRGPLRTVLVVLGVWLGFTLASPENEPAWYSLAEHVLLIAFIAVLTWLVASMVYAAEDLALAAQQQASSNRARRIRTQAVLLRRVVVAVVVLLGVAGVLLTFDGARAAGASLFASAGIVSLVAGLAAQSALANVFAGMQLAFSDAIRVDDIVIAEGEWGRIEEITLTYVVLHTWDDRRLILPSTYFTSTPFENWTRRAGELLGTVEFDLDWRVPVAAMREELEYLLSRSDLWDGRVGLLQVFDATGGLVRVRALVSAADATSQIDLKYYLRESLLLWLQREVPYALPRSRYQQMDPAPAPGEDVSPLVREVEEGPVSHEAPYTVTVDTPAVARLDPEVAAQQEAALARERRRRARRPRRGADAEDEPELPAARRPRPSAEETRAMDLAELGLADARGEAPRAGEEGTAAEAAPAGEPVVPGRGTTARRTSIMARSSSSTTGSRFFSGSADAQARAQAFAGPGEEALQEREEIAERHRAAALGEQPGEASSTGGTGSVAVSSGEAAPAEADSHTAVMPAVRRPRDGAEAPWEVVDDAGTDTGDEAGRRREELPGGDIRGRDGGDGD